MQNILDSLYASVIADGRWIMYLTGLWNTILISVTAICIGSIIGILVAVIKNYALTNKKLRPLEVICDIYLTVIRGTPTLIQLMIIYFAVFASMSDGTLAAIVGFSINAGAYIAEIIRSGIMSIDKGQNEAGRALGFTQGQTMRLIILPQALKISIPPLFNEFITLVKETSVAGMIAVPELTKIAGNIRGRAFETTPLYIVAIIYLILVIALTQVQKRIEKRLGASD